MDTVSNASGRVLCPCNRCKRTVSRTRRVVEEHIEDWGIWDENVLGEQMRAHASKRPVDFSLVNPSLHKRSHLNKPTPDRIEQKQSEVQADEIMEEHVQEPLKDPDMEEMIEAFFGVSDGENTDNEERENDPSIQRLQQLAHTPVCEGSRASILRTCLTLLNLQSTYGWSDASVTALFKLMKTTILPNENEMPESRDVAKKILTDVGMDYTTIHACQNDCILFRGEYANLDVCPKCQESRYRQDLSGTTIPAKVLRHFPIIPRISHMFKCPSIAKLMAWHSTSRSSDGVMRTPADSPAWQHIDLKWPEFKKEPRHLRLGLAMDGVNPYRLRSTTWSTWPVVLVNYNIPPWLCIKKGHLLLALLIPGKYKVKNMDVYLALVVDELKQLWEGIPIQDLSRRSGYWHFNMKAILMWTMHDFPCYGECSGLATSGYHACPIRKWFIKVTRCFFHLIIRYE